MTIAVSNISLGAIETKEMSRSKPVMVPVRCDGADCVHFVDDIFLPVAALPEQHATRHEQACMIFDRR